MNLRPSQTLGTPKLGILLEAGSGEQKTLCVEIMAVLSSCVQGPPGWVKE